MYLMFKYLTILEKTTRNNWNTVVRCSMSLALTMSSAADKIITYKRLLIKPEKKNPIFSLKRS